jgi:branched-chain amino acid aminotransferase
MPHLFLNGRIIDEGEARVSTEDRGLLMGDGLFESVRCYGGRPFRLGAHLARMRASAEFLRLRVPAEDGAIAGAIGELAGLNGCPEAYVRITLTRGVAARGARLEAGGEPTLVIHVRALTPYPAEQYRHGAKLIVSRYRQSSSSPLARHKCCNYLLYLLARQEAMDAGANGAALLNELGQVTEEAFSNIFLVREGRVTTPPVHCGLLPGIARAAVIELAGRLGIVCAERPVPAAELFDADEMFLTNSLMEVMPVKSVDKRALRAAAPGVVTQRLAEAYRELVQGETAC